MFAALIRFWHLVLAALAIASAVLFLAIGWASHSVISIVVAATLAAYLIAGALTVVRDAIRSGDDRGQDSRIVALMRQRDSSEAATEAPVRPTVRINQATGTIIIARRRQWLNSLRSFEVYLDGEQITLLSDGEVLRLDTPAGHHRLQVWVDSTRSRPEAVQIGPRETAHFECGSLISGWELAILPIAALRTYSLYVRRKPDD